MKVILFGVGGGTGSGKTTVAYKLREAIGRENVVIICQDSYYKDRSHLSPEERENINYDHPDAFDNDLLLEHLKLLKAGKPIDMPIYDFTRHIRKDETIRIEPKEVIILEGIMVLADKRIRDLMDIKVYVDTPNDIRVIRRIKRDIQERGRSLESIIRQYLETVRPMHYQFVEPSKRYADIIIPEGGFNQNAIDILVGAIKERLKCMQI